MLKPSTDRLDYGALLAPPPGYEVAAAVGTTYSLDLDTLVGTCIALGLSEETDSQLQNSPVFLLEALRRTAEKVVVFCESGQIHVPNHCTPLYILLEKIVYGVMVQKQAHAPVYPSFHPKFWLIKYKNSHNDFIFRTIVLSRNLTFDRSWDVSVSLDGSPVPTQDAQSIPISDFLLHLGGYLSGKEANIKAKRKIVDELAHEILNVSFQLDSGKFSGFDFIPIGVGNTKGKKYSMRDYPIFSSTFNEAFVMSPFLSAGIIREMNTRNKLIKNMDCTLVTRRAALEVLSEEDCSRFKIYTMKDSVVDGESVLSETDLDTRKQDIHAKVYLWRRASESELYLGSANATHSAMNGNIEMMICLRGPYRYLNSTFLTRDLFNGEPDNPGNPFELTKLPPKGPTDPNADVELQNMIKTLCRSRPSALIRETEGKYDVVISFEKLSDAFGLTISPMLSNKSAKVAREAIIEGLELLQISEFYRITAEKDGNIISRIVKIVTHNIPENREKAVVASVVTDRQSFIQYVAFLLGDDFLLSFLEIKHTGESGFFGKGSTERMPALYEGMLKAAAAKPEKFVEIEWLLRTLSSEGVVPEGFTGLMEEFRKAVGMHG